MRYGYDDIAERFGVIPERMADFLALMGDAVDNIPGVPGVGRKTAATLLKHYDTLPGVFDNLGAVPKLKFRNAAFVAQIAARAPRGGVPVATAHRHRLRHAVRRAPGDLARRVPDLAALDEFYERLGFGRLLREQARRIAGR